MSKKGKIYLVNIFITLSNLIISIICIYAVAGFTLGNLNQFDNQVLYFFYSFISYIYAFPIHYLFIILDFGGLGTFAYTFIIDSFIISYLIIKAVKSRIV